MPKPSPWFLYLLRCSDSSIYTGITNDLKKRIAAHNAGKGAKYTRGRGPVKLLKKFKFKNKSEAAKEEYAVKQLPASEKLKFKVPSPVRRKQNYSPRSYSPTKK